MVIFACLNVSLVNNSFVLSWHFCGLREAGDVPAVIIARHGYTASWSALSLPTRRVLQLEMVPEFE